MKRLSRRKALASGLAALTLATSAVSLAACSSDSADGPITPDGYTLTEVPGFGFSLAVPTDWTTLTSDDLDDGELVQKVADALGRDADSLRETAATFHLISVDTGVTGYAENLAVSQYELEDGLPPEDELAEITADDQVSSSDYAQRTTGSGADAALYTANGTLSGSDEAFHIAFMAVSMESGATADADESAAADTAPAPTTATFVMIRAASADRAQELADVILGSA